MDFNVPKGYSIISEDEHADMVRQSAEPVKFQTAGVIQNGKVTAVFDLSDDDEPEYLVDCN